MALPSNRIIFLALLLTVLCGAGFKAANLTTPDSLVWIWFCIMLVLLILLWKSVVSTISRTVDGLNLLKAQDNSSRLAATGNHDADMVVMLFNSIMTSLKEQRLYNEEQKHFLALLLEYLPLGLGVCDFDGRITEVNPAFRKFLGLSKTDSIEGLKLDSLPGEVGKRISSAINEKKPTMFRTSDGAVWQCTVLHYMEKGFKRPFILLEKVTSLVSQAEKAAYQRVIRTISHEVNNTVAGVLPLMDVIVTTSDDEEIARTAGIVASCCGDMSRLISKFADVVKIPVPSLSRVNLGNFVHSAMPFLESLGKGKVKVEPHYGEGTLEVDADPVLLQHCLVNIVKNAVESVMTVPGVEGVVEIQLDPYKRRLSVIDNGAGVAPDVAEKLFTPFFTSKPGGNGIGLMLVAEVMRRHGFGYRLFTDKSTGLTHFEITF